MIKCLYLLLFVAASHAFVAKEKRETENIPAPKLVRLTLVDNPANSLKVDWNKVNVSRHSDRIEGYKVKVWEHPMVKKYRYETVNGQRVLLSEYAPARHPISNETSTHNARDILVHGVENNSTLVHNVKSGVTYEVRVLAYNRNGDGPLSQPMWINVSSKKDGSNHRDGYTVD